MIAPGEQDLIEQITAAFSDTPLPPADALLNHHCSECLATSEAYGGKPWNDVSLENLLAGRETALLTVAAWRYYLPAVLIWCIRAPVEVDAILDNVVYQLEPPTSESGVPEWFEERAPGFTEEQRRAIVAWLDWYRERDERNWAAAGGEPPHHVYNALGFWRR